MLETIVALGVIISGVVGVMSLTISNQTASSESSERLLAVNLAREGIEVIRNIRDSNWLQCEYVSSALNCSDWDEGMMSGADATAVLLFDFENNAWALDFTPDDITHANTRVWRRSSGPVGSYIGTYFQSTEATPANATLSDYRRLLTLNEICADKTVSLGNCTGGSPKIGIRVQSRVDWEIGGKSNSLTAEERLFNWR